MTNVPDDELLDDVLPSDQQEDEADLGAAIDFQDAVVQTADWTVETLYGQLRKGNIDLDPGFQRRQAWDDVRKGRLIESLIVGLPIPNIVMAENSSHRGRFLVIDGKQRLLTVREFLDGGLKLRGLDLRPELNGKTFNELEGGDQEYLENSTIRATIIKNISDPNFLYVMFFRLNAGSLQLSPQELRKALVGGNAINAIDEYIEGSEAFKAIFGPRLDRRMRDSELVLRYVAFDLFYDEYAGDLKKFLDRTVEHFEGDWPARSPELQQELEKLDRALSTASEIFETDVFKKWVEDRYERRMNRAVFDVITRFFTDGAVAAAAKGRKSEVIDAYKHVCSDPDFRSAIEKTTKSEGATRCRIDMWGEALAAALGMHYDDTLTRIS